MASKERKVATKGVKKAKKEPEVLDTLKNDHLRYLEDSSKDIHISKLEMGNMEQVLRNKNLELELLNRDIEQTKRIVAEKHARYRDIIGNRTKFIASIKDLYNISEKFAYDPKSGAITRD